MADFAGATCAPVTLAVVVLPIPYNLRINIDTVSKTSIHRGFTLNSLQGKTAHHNPHPEPPSPQPSAGSTMRAMTGLAERLPHVAAFPEALGTGLLLHTDVALDDGLSNCIDMFISTYEAALSRFKDDSTVGRMRTATHGGTFDFPDWTSGLFCLYDRLFAATNGAIDPCVGEDLIRLGYDESYSFTTAPDAAEHAGAIHGRAVWSADVERHGTTLITHSPVALDFGACGKGYLVDLLAGMLGDGAGHPQPIQYVIDAGGDLLVHTDEAITIALEDPADPANAVGTVEISHGPFCASAPSRRHWSDAAGHQLHHLLNAIDGLPVDDVAATWVAVMPPSSAITTKTSAHGSNASTTANRDTDDSSNTAAAHVPVTLADGLATALFTTSAAQLRAHFDFECAILNANRAAAQSPNFPGGFFTH